MISAIKLREWKEGVCMSSLDLPVDGPTLEMFTHILRQKYQRMAQEMGGIVLSINVDARVRVDVETDKDFHLAAPGALDDAEEPKEKP